MLAEEEDKFNRTIDQGLEILAEMEQKMVAEGSTCCPAPTRLNFTIPMDSLWT